MSFAIFWERTWQEFVLLLKAPLIQPEMWWIITPLIVTFIVMTFYFGVYRREELGWNTALGNTIVLLFVTLDLLRHIYNYSIPGSLHNFATYPLNFLIVFIVILEAIFLFRFAFTHAIPKQVMFFIASPLPVNLQAYIITALVYLRFQPNMYTISAAVLLFLVLFSISKGLQLIQLLMIETEHRGEFSEIKILKSEARKLRAKAKKTKGKKAKELRKQSHEKILAERALEKELREGEQAEHGKLVLSKKIKK